MKSLHRRRAAEELVEQRLGQFPVVVLTGARQTGKTTLVTRIPSAGRRKFRTLDDPDVLHRALHQPHDLLAESAQLTLDEVQRAPDLLLAIKRTVDAGRTPGQFLLTGSANLLLMARVSESLAGRAIYLYLRGLTESEKAGAPLPGPWGSWLDAASISEAERALRHPIPPSWRWERAILEGGFPAAALQPDPGSRQAWLEGYAATYVERDVRQLARIDAALDFRRLMRLVALRTGRFLNQADLARDAELSHSTAHRYLNLLETSFLIARVPPYAGSRTKRIVKMPKLYWGDTSLAAHLAGVHEESGLRSHESAGGLLENLVWHHLRCWADTEGLRAEVMTWRTEGGEEVDFVLERGRRLLPIEVKAATSLGASDLTHLGSFLDEHRERAPFGVILCGGPDVRPVARNIIAVPLGAALASN